VNPKERICGAFFGSYVRANGAGRESLLALFERVEAMADAHLECQLIDVAAPDELPDEPYFIWLCVSAALERPPAQAPELLSFCSDTLRLSWADRLEEQTHTGCTNRRRPLSIGVSD